MSWVVQGGFLRRLGEGEPAPEGATPVELPDDLLDAPERYTVVGDRLVERDDPAVESEQRAGVLKLTQEEIAKVKKAIREGRL